ncbi:unnamed protein product, partial [Merluccius merluccius]
MLLVEPGLYIGAEADLNNVQGLAEAAVSHVLSVVSEDPSPALPSEGRVQHKWINVLDEPTSDLLTHMDDSFLFIQEAVEGGGAALVHCQAGRSRSATMVTAYLMRRHELSFSEAYGCLQRSKPDVQVNSGFQDQLQLYETMGWRVDPSNTEFRRYRLRLLAQQHSGNASCTSYFIEPVQWMESALIGQLDGP